MRSSSARSFRLAFATLVAAFTFGQLTSGTARADDDTCDLSQVGTKCVGSDGGTLFTTCLAIQTTLTAQDGGMTTTTAGGCVLIEGTYCPTANANQPCGDAGDTCQIQNVATSSGSTGGGEQTSATSYEYGLCEPAGDAGTDQSDDGGTTTETSGDGSTGAAGSSGSTTNDAGTNGSTTSASSDAGAASDTSSDSSDGGCTLGQMSSEDTTGSFALAFAVGALGLAVRRRRG